MLAALALVAFATPAWQTVVVALPFLVLGLLIRVWASGYLTKNAELCISGPYAHVRHPLYLANLVIALGLYILANNFFFTIATLPLVVCTYWYTLRGEEKFLREVFGTKYEAYQQQVPRLLPRLRPLRPAGNAAANHFSWQRVWFCNHFCRDVGSLLLVIAVLCAKLLVLNHFGYNYLVTYGMWPR